MMRDQPIHSLKQKELQEPNTGYTHSLNIVMALKVGFGEHLVNETGMLVPANPSLFTRKFNNLSCLNMESRMESL